MAKKSNSPVKDSLTPISINLDKGAKAQIEAVNNLNRNKDFQLHRKH